MVAVVATTAAVIAAVAAAMASLTALAAQAPSAISLARALHRGPAGTSSAATTLCGAADGVQQGDERRGALVRG